MKLSKLIKGLKNITVRGSVDVEVRKVETDSRLVRRGDMFVAVKGTVVDGHRFISKAVESGASAVVCESLPDDLSQEVAYIQVEDSSCMAGVMATRIEGEPSRHLKLVGVTGTNGKTTIATLLYNLFMSLGYKTGLISTVCNYVGDEAVPTDHTTPDPVTLNRLLGRMMRSGCSYVFMEVSSHAVVQERIAGLDFAGAIFTNLTRDHLDYHKTFDNYLHAKQMFFDKLSPEAFAITNADDRNGLIMTQNSKADVKTYSLHSGADYKALILEDGFEGMLLEIDSTEVFVRFIGRFNAYNILAAVAAADMLGVEREELLVALSTQKPVAGRFEPLYSPRGYTALVDYAHTPDALKNVLLTIREISHAMGKIITVVGAGGERDHGKRPLMASQAASLSDKLILTSDNPRHENPQSIIDDMKAGLDRESLSKTLCIVSRREAIRTACMMAEKGDVVLVAGKGHENYQDVDGVKHHFDDKEVINDIFKDEKN